MPISQTMTQSLANTQISRPVNVDTVVPTTASRQQSISDIVSQFSTMSINGAKSTYPVVTKRLPRSLLPKFVGSKAKSATASDIRIEARINARRDRIVKKLGYPSIQRPKQQTSAVVGAARKHVSNHRYPASTNVATDPEFFPDPTEVQHTWEKLPRRQGRSHRWSYRVVRRLQPAHLEHADSHPIGVFRPQISSQGGFQHPCRTQTGMASSPSPCQK